MFLEFVLILPLGTQIAPIEDVSLRSIVRDPYVDLSQIDTGYFRTRWRGYHFHLIGSHGFVLGACPADHHGLGQIPRPIQDNGLIALAIGEGEFAILKTNGRVLVLDTPTSCATR